MTRRAPLTTGSDWNFALIEEFDHEIARIAHEKYQLDTYPNQIEVISSEQMMDAYSSVGMPVGYHHWSFGKHFVETETRYKRGHMGLAYEIVINSSPCIAYLMEENTMAMQALVIAHACYGHNSFFKGNYLFRTWTDATAIIDYLVFARKYVAECEERYGVEQVEAILDSCHALMNYGVDRYELGNAFGHIALEVDDAYATCEEVKRRGGHVTREAGPMKHGTTVIAFVEDPDGYKIEFIQKKAAA